MLHTILNLIRRKPSMVRWYRAIDRNCTDLGLLFTCDGCGKQLLNPPNVVAHCGWQKAQAPDNIARLFLPDKRINNTPRAFVMRAAFDDDAQVIYTRGTP